MLGPLGRDSWGNDLVNQRWGAIFLRLTPRPPFSHHTAVPEVDKAIARSKSNRRIMGVAETGGRPALSRVRALAKDGEKRKGFGHV